MSTSSLNTLPTSSPFYTAPSTRQAAMHAAIVAVLPNTTVRVADGCANGLYVSEDIVVTYADDWTNDELGLPDDAPRPAPWLVSLMDTSGGFSPATWWCADTAAVVGVVVALIKGGA